MATKNELTLGLIQMRMSESKRLNLDKAIRMIGEASERGARIVCLPELFTSLYFPQEKNFKAERIAEPIPGPTTEALSKAAKKNKIVLVGGSICEKYEGRLYNTAVVFDEDGKSMIKYRKMHIPHDPYFYEGNYFKRGDLGYQVVSTKYAKMGIMVCFDQWYPEAARINALLGADILFYPTAIGQVKGIAGAEGDWREAWEIIQRGHAIVNGVIVAAVNRVGREKNIDFWGGSFVADQFGKILIRGGNREETLIVKCDIRLGERVRKGWGFLRNRRPDTYRRLSE